MFVIRLAVSIAFLICGGLSPAIADTEKSPITSVDEIRELPIAEAEKGLPFAFDAQIFHIGVNRSGLFVGHDRTGIFAAITPGPDIEPSFELGSIIRISGTTHPGSFIPHLVIDHLEILSHQALPEPLPLTYDNLFKPELDCAWVSLEGFVLGVSVNTPYLTLQVETFGSLVDVVLENMAGSEADARQFVHRHIKLRGVAASQANDKRQLTGRNIRVQDFSEIDLTVSRGEIPLIRVEKLLTPQWSNVRKVRIQGVVTSSEYQRLYMRGTGGSVLVKVRGGVDAKIGDIIEVLGTVSVEPFSPVFYAEQITVLGSGGNTEPVPFNPTTDAYTSTLNNELVTTPGELLSITKPENSEQTILQCRTGNTTFDAILPGGYDAAFKPGSRLRFTGICQLSSNSYQFYRNRIEGFRIALRSVDDIQLLTAASWWTLRRVLIGFAIAVAATLLALIWAILLRKRVAHQTDVMRSQVEREAMLGERHRIARELHDTVEQNMAGLSMQLDNVSQAIKKSGNTAGIRSLKIANTMLHACRTEARNSVIELRAPFHNGSSIIDIIGDSFIETAGHSGAEFSRETTGTVYDIGHFRTRHVLRAVQEAILNAAKHAAPENIKISADYAPRELTISIADDGCGFDSAAHPPTGHFGLIGMRERCERIGATLGVQSGASGTMLTFKIPREDPEETEPPL